MISWLRVIKDIKREGVLIPILAATTVMMTGIVYAKDAPRQDSEVTRYIMKEINAYRASLKLSSVQTSDETCSFAKIRAKEIASGFNHDGYDRRESAGTLPFSKWTIVTENIAMTADYKKVESLWQNSPGHAENMRADTPYVCVMQYGNYFAYIGMKP